MWSNTQKALAIAACTLFLIIIAVLLGLAFADRQQKIADQKAMPKINLQELLSRSEKFTQEHKRSSSKSNKAEPPDLEITTANANSQKNKGDEQTFQDDYQAFLQTRNLTDKMNFVSVTRDRGNHDQEAFDKGETLKAMRSPSRINLKKDDYQENGYDLKSKPDQLLEFESSNKVLKPSGKLCLFQGSVIPAVMVSGITSEISGQITAQVIDDVLDSISGKAVLLPKGSKLIGNYGVGTKSGQKRVLVAFKRIIFPNGSYLKLNSMPGIGADGFAGLEAQSNSHLLSVFTASILLSSVDTAQNIASAETSSNYDKFKNNLSADGGERADNIIADNLLLNPTLTIVPGYVFSVSVTEDLIFDHAYGDPENDEDEFLLG